MTLPMFGLFGIITLAWFTVIRGLRRCQQRPKDVATWIYWGGFVTLALTLSAPVPPVATLVDRLTGTAGAADYLEHAAALLTALFWLAYLVRLHGLTPHDITRLLHIAGLVAVALLVMSARFDLAPGRIDYRLGPHPDQAAYFMGCYRFVYRGVFAIELFQVVSLLRRYIVIAAHRPVLRARLRLLTWLLLFTIGYVGYECLTVVIRSLPALHSRLLELRAILILFALVAPSGWYARWLAWCAWSTERRASHKCSCRLAPLWRALYPVEPGLSLLASPGLLGAWPIWWDLPFRVRRQLAEIRDWSRRLRPYHVPEAACLAEDLGRQAGVPTAALPQLVEAAVLAVALRTWSQHRPVLARPLVLPSIGVPAEQEAEVLAQVADFFVHSPVVRDVVAHFDRASIVSMA